MARKENPEPQNVQKGAIAAVSEMYIKNGVFIDVILGNYGYIARVYWYKRPAEVYEKYFCKTAHEALLLAESFVEDELQEKAQ